MLPCVLLETEKVKKALENGASYIIDKNGNTIADFDMQLVKDGENIQKKAEEDSSYAALAQAHEKISTFSGLDIRIHPRDIIRIRLRSRIHLYLRQP